MLRGRGADHGEGARVVPGTGDDEALGVFSEQRSTPRTNDGFRFSKPASWRPGSPFAGALFVAPPTTSLATVEVTVAFFVMTIVVGFVTVRMYVPAWMPAPLIAVPLSSAVNRGRRGHIRRSGRGVAVGDQAVRRDRVVTDRDLPDCGLRDRRGAGLRERA
jgi:hypothetical protein